MRIRGSANVPWIGYPRTARTVQSWGASGGGGPAGVSISIGSVYGPLQFAFAWTDYTLTSSSGPDGAY
jgi:hypothetical protein